MLPFAVEQVVRAEVSEDHATWYEVGVTGGSVSASRASQVRWTCDVTLDLGRDVDPYGMWLRLFYGVRVPRWQPVYVPWGVYRVEDSEASTSALRVTGNGLEKALQDAAFPTPRTVPGEAGGTVQQVVSRLVRDVLPDAAVDWRLSVDRIARDIVVESDRWGLIAGGSDDPSFARALGGEMYFDGRGVFVAAPVPTTAAEPVLTVASGQAGMLVSPRVVRSRSGVYNLVSATGESTGDGPEIGPGYAWDIDPGSRTYAGPDPVNRPDLAGPFGVVTRFYSSPQLRTVDQCTQAARGILANALGLHKAVSFDQLVHPGLEPGDVVLLEEEPGVMVPHLIDSWSTDLATGAMSVQTRSTRPVSE